LRSAPAGESQLNLVELLEDIIGSGLSWQHQSLNFAPRFTNIFASEFDAMSQSEQAERTNGATPTEQAGSRPAARMMECAVPKRITGTRRETIRLKFRQDISDACVEFRYSNDNLIITSEGRPDHTFSFHFTPNDNHVKELEIGAKLIEKESQELLTIACFDSEDTGIQQEFRWVKLQPGVSVRDIEIIGPTLNLIWVWVRNPYLQCLLILVVVSWLLFHYVSGIKSWASEKMEHAGIILGFTPPNPYTGSWSGGSRNDWRIFPSGWDFASNNDLIVKGPEAGLSRIEKDRPQGFLEFLKRDGFQGLFEFVEKDRLYDFFEFVANFALTYRQNQKSAAWVVHAQNENDYYLFKLTFPTNDKDKTAVLEGSVYRNGRKYGGLSPPQKSLYNFHMLAPGDHLFMQLRVLNKGKFEHCFHVDRINSVSKDIYARRTPLNFDDPENKYPYGAFGFRGEDQTDEIEVVRVGLEGDPAKVAAAPPCQ